jgi:hypothetical protein
MGVYKFSEAGSFALPRVEHKSMLVGNSAFGLFLAEYLVIAGGGNSHHQHGGGGGAGGYRSSVLGELSGGNSLPEQRLSLSVGQSYSVTVGAGAPKNFGAGTAKGSNSSLAGIVSIGGGAMSTDTNIRNGGSGAGANYVGGSTSGFGTVGQGSNGGVGGPANGNYPAGGGGGAGGAGLNFVGNTRSGNGGPGIFSSITGVPTARAGGGAGGNYIGGIPGLGGMGGGGDAGAIGANNPGQDGAINTGSGGGAAHYQDGNSNGGGGGSGVIILRYPLTKTITLGSGLVGNTVVSNNNKITRITAGTGVISFIESPTPQAPRYWRYIEGSAITNHHPRVSRIDFVDESGTETRLVTYTTDNCSDTGTFVIGTVNLDLGAGNEKWFVGTKIYATFNGSRAANASVQYSYNNSTWQDAFSVVAANYNFPSTYTSNCGSFFGHMA